MRAEAAESLQPTAPSPLSPRARWSAIHARVHSPGCLAVGAPAHGVQARWPCGEVTRLSLRGRRGDGEGDVEAGHGGDPREGRRSVHPVARRLRRQRRCSRMRLAPPCTAQRSSPLSRQQASGIYLIELAGGVAGGGPVAADVRLQRRAAGRGPAASTVECVGDHAPHGGQGQGLQGAADQAGSHANPRAAQLATPSQPPATSRCWCALHWPQWSLQGVQQMYVGHARPGPRERRHTHTHIISCSVPPPLAQAVTDVLRPPSPFAHWKFMTATRLVRAQDA